MSLSGPPPPTPEPIDAPRRKQRSGCLVALYVLFGVGAVLLVGGGIAAYFALQSETGQQLMEAAREGAAWAEEAAQAPGTDALREAGCDTAMVSTFGELMTFVARFLPEEQAREMAESDLAAETLVMCQTALFSEGDVEGCEALARAYGQAVPDPPERFVVMHQTQGGSTRCQGLYAPDGSYLGDLESASR